MSLQKTIKSPAAVQGRGLFGGEPCALRFLPAATDAGITFVRTDLPSPVSIAADIAHVAKRPRRTSLLNGAVSVETVEHVLAAVWGLGIDNLVVEMDGAETPSTDGSPLPFVQAIQKAGLTEQDSERKTYVIDEPAAVSEGDAMLAALPGPDDCLDILYDLDYGAVPSIGRQVVAFRLGKDDLARQIAPARTFLLEAEAREFQARGMGKHLTPRDLLVMGESGPVDNELRFRDEHARHKVCDLIGDLALLGRRLRGRIVAYKSGHELNHALVRKLLERISENALAVSLVEEPVMDIRRIMRLLPHRYPFLMVDRILRLDSDRMVTGIKNVTINEPFFQGHYPGQPIMPGVMILEAMAQISGILLSRRLEHTGKVAVLLSMDRVKMRRSVRPGDQLILEAEALHVRTRTGHTRCRALVGEEVAAEAEIKFMLVDAEPV
ncbi:MAG TPA: 3-hydroxyacyl-[acyl-carrier-protein] dehydratase FabZ [Phycisphaerales bacterium]|nr:3-hydroxyacyl-[acyl-carrier-protein] dehydratase FabZ [Phycisphaerales bacterium]